MHLTACTTPPVRSTISTPETTDALKGAQNINILGITFTSGLSVALRVQQLISSNAQALYALKLLRVYGLCDTAIQAQSR